MSVDTVDTNQHYVPQMLFRGFATTPGGDQVWVFDKKTGKKFRSSIRAIAAERGYYDLTKSVTLDAAMNRADGAASQIINEIRERKSLAGLKSDKDRALLAGFGVMQMLRTRGFQNRMSHLGHSMITAIEERGFQVPPEWKEELTEEQQRKSYLASIPQHTRDLLPHLLTKNLLLFRTNSDLPFCISDNPVALTNTVNDGDGLRGTLGLAVQGIEIYLPISTELTLAYICPSIGIAYDLDQTRLRQIGGLFNEDAFYYLQARATGKALMLKPDNVRFQNSLQIRNAERFVVSCRDDFDDAADMVAKDPEARFGPRLTTS